MILLPSSLPRAIFNAFSENLLFLSFFSTFQINYHLISHFYEDRICQQDLLFINKHYVHLSNHVLYKILKLHPLSQANDSKPSFSSTTIGLNIYFVFHVDSRKSTLIKVWPNRKAAVPNGEKMI